MASFVVLTTLSTVILLSPPQSLTVLLELMPIPLPSKLTLFAVVVGNAVLSTALERWAPVGKVVTFVSKKWKAHSRHRRRGGNPYKAVESGMNG